MMILPDANCYDEYYLLQLIELDHIKRYVVYSRFGVIGFRGKKLKKHFAEKDKAKQAFAQM